MQFSARRDLRETMFRAFVARGAKGGAHDNAAIMRETVELRAERARCSATRASPHYRLADTMAKTPEAALGLLNRVWTPARTQALREARGVAGDDRRRGRQLRLAAVGLALLRREAAQGAVTTSTPASSRPICRSTRSSPPLSMSPIACSASPLSRATTLPLHHPDARAWTAIGPDGAPIALFIGDYFARPSKRSGAWMSALPRSAEARRARPADHRQRHELRAAGEGEACLLSLDEAHTLFHEFGHALHGMLSDVTYPLLAGTHVSRDFVEFPSQLYEHWLERPETLRRFAAPLSRRRADARSADRAARGGAPLQSGLRDGRVRRLRAGRHGVAPACRPARSTSRHSRRARSPRSACRRRSRRAIRRRISSTSFPASGYSAGYYSYLGRRFSTPTASRRSRRAATIFDPALAARLEALRLFGRQSARARRSLPRLPRPRSRAGRAAAQARVGGELTDGEPRSPATTHASESG